MVTGIKKVSEEFLLNSVVSDIKKKGSRLWVVVLECLYNNKNIPLTVCDINRILTERYNYRKVWDNRIRQVLYKFEKLGVVDGIVIDGLRGKRWVITDFGCKVYDMLKKLEAET